MFSAKGSSVGTDPEESLALFLVLVATIIVPYCALLEPLGQTMLEVKSILCDGNQQFVVGLHLDLPGFYSISIDFGYFKLANRIDPDALASQNRCAVRVSLGAIV